METVMAWVNHYGYLVVFLVPMIELLAFGLPVEITMSYAGFLVSQGKMDFLLSIIIASTGSMLGMAIAYGLGSKLGAPFFDKYGHYIHLGPEKLEKTSNWFDKYGSKVLIIAYFVPGLRHITGYFSGINHTDFKKYFLHVYVGALLWVSTFISLGKILGPQWKQFHSSIKKYLIVLVVVVAFILILGHLYKNNRSRIEERILSMLTRALDIFHSLGSVKFLVISAAGLFLSSFIFMLGLIQDYLANEFIQFNQIVLLIMGFLFSQGWASLMEFLNLLGSNQALVSISLLILALIFIGNKDKWLELGFWLIVIPGGEALEEVLHFIFHQLLTGKSFLSAMFPGEQSFMILLIYGFLVFIIIRHSNSNLVRTFVIAFFSIILLFNGLSVIYLGSQLPSDVLAGYVFALVWLNLNIVLLEIFRLLQKV